MSQHTEAPIPNPYPHVNTVKMSELIITSSAYIINRDSPMTSVANTVAMTTLAERCKHAHLLNREGLLLPRVNPDNIEQLSIETGCDVKAETAYKEILESVNLGTFTLSTQSTSSESKHDHEDNESIEPESCHEAECKC